MASRAAIRAVQSIAAGMKNRGRYRRPSAVLGEPLDQRPGNTPARPILPRTWWRLDFPLNPAENAGSRTNVLAIGVTDIKPTAEGFSSV